MKQAATTTINWRGTDHAIHHHLTGGTAERPTLKAGHELLLNWAMEFEADDQPLPACNLLNDPDGLLARLVNADVRHDIHHQWRAGAVSPVTEPFPAADVNLLLLPKSLELLELYLAGVRSMAGPETELAIAFPTKYFTPRLLEIAALYAGEVEQSRAWKKHRLLTLSGFLAEAPDRPLHELITYGDSTYYRHFGTFCAGHVDYGTQFLLENWTSTAAPDRILDACCGAGVIAHQLSLRHPEATISGFDISFPAITSARKNEERLGPFADFSLGDRIPAEPYDLIVMNPPFHAEQRTTVAVALEFFRQAADTLTPNGAFVVVGNRHLGYGKHLGALFKTVETVAENDKFAVYRATGPSHSGT